MISRICEEFGYTPGQALALDGEEWWTVMDIMELRSYQRSYQAVQQAEDSPESAKALAALPESMRSIVRETEFAMVREAMTDG